MTQEEKVVYGQKLIAIGTALLKDDIIMTENDGKWYQLNTGSDLSSFVWGRTKIRIERKPQYRPCKTFDEATQFLGKTIAFKNTSDGETSEVTVIKAIKLVYGAEGNNLIFETLFQEMSPSDIFHNAIYAGNPVGVKVTQ